MVLSLPVLVKQNRIPEGVHDFSEGGVSRSNGTNLQFPFRVHHTGIYVDIQHHFVYFTSEKGSKQVLTGYDRVHGTYTHTLSSRGSGVGRGNTVRYVYLS